MDKTSIDVPGATFTGNITIHGDMFNIHDNQHVHVNVNRVTMGSGYFVTVTKCPDTDVT